MSDIQIEKEALVTPLFSDTDTQTIGGRLHHSIDISDCSTKEISTMTHEFQGFVKIPRSLVQDPAIKNLSCKQKVVLFKLIELAAWKETKTFCEGEYVTVKRNQVFYSLRYIVDACNEYQKDPEDLVSMNDAQRLIIKLVKLNFVIQHVIQRRNMLTLCFLDTLDKENTLTDTTCDMPVIRDRYDFDTNKKNIKKDKKEKEYKRASRAKRAAPAAPSADALSLASSLFSSIQKWKQNFSQPNENKWAQEFDKILKKYPNDRILSVVAWLPSHEFWRKNILCPLTLLKQFERLEAEMQETSQKLDSKKNFDYVLECKRDNPNLPQVRRLIIKGNYVINETTGKDLSFNMKHEAFKEALQHIVGLKYA